MLFRICSVCLLLALVAALGCLGNTAYRAGHPCNTDTDCVSAGADLFCNDQKLCEAEACTTETRSCYVGAAGCDKDGKNCVGACKAGTQTCKNGFWGKCEGQVIPSAELCDGLDNDCDGSVDEGTADTTICTIEEPKIAKGAGGLNACVDKKKACTIDPKAICGAKKEACEATPTLVFISAATKSFRMGVKPGQNRSREPDEGSASGDVNRDFDYNYGIGQTEVTQKQFKAVMGYLPKGLAGEGDDLPVHNVTWHEAAMYTNLLSTAHSLQNCFECSDFDPSGGKPFTGTCVRKRFNQNDEPRAYMQICNGFRLPTEAEWSYAYRAQDDGGTYTDFYTGDMDKPKEKESYKDNKLGLIAFYKENSGGKPQKAESLKPNGWRLFGMSGNVGEWVFDFYANSLSVGGAKESNSTGPTTGSNRVWRGGHYLSPPYDCRAARRNQLAPDKSQTDGKVGIGFRVARSLLKAK